MLLWAIRAVFVLVVAGLGVRMAAEAVATTKPTEVTVNPAVLFVGVVTLALVVLALVAGDRIVGRAWARLYPIRSRGLLRS